MTRLPGAPRVPARLGLVAAAALAGLLGAAVPARAGGPPMQFTTVRPELPALPPVEDLASSAAGGLPLYERAPIPNENALEPQYDTGASDPLQPSVISRGSKVAESGGFSRNSSVNSAQESRMKPGLGFALHVPTE